MIYFNETEEIYRLWELSCRCCLYHDSYQRVPRQELLQRWGDFCPSSLSEEERFSFCLLCWAVEVAVRYKELMEESYPADFSKRMTGQSHLAEALASSLLGNAMFEPKEGERSPLPLLKKEEAPGKGEAFPYLKEELFYRLKCEEDKLTIVPLEESERERIRYAYQRLLDAQAVKPFLELGYRLYSTLKKGKGKLEVQKGNQEVQKGNQEEQKGSQEEQKVYWKALLSSLPLAELEAIYGETQNLAEPDWKKRRKKNLEEQKLDIYDNIISYLEKVTKVTDRERRAKDRDRAEEKAERNAELLNGRKAKHNERNNERIKEEVKAEIKDEEKESCQDLTSIRIPISFLESSAETILLTLLVYRQALAQNGSAEDYLPFPGVYSYTLGLYGNIRVAPDNAFKMVKAEAERGEGELLKDILRIADHYMLRISPEALEELEKAQKAPEEEVLHCTPLYSKAGDGFSSLRSKAGDDSSPLHSKAGDDSSFLITSQEGLLKELFSLSSDRAPQRWSLWVGSEEAREVSREQEEVVLEGLRRSSYISLRDKGGREIYEALSFLKACKRAPKNQQGGLDYYNAFYPLVFCRKGKSPTILSEREENAREMYQRAASLLPAFLQEHRSDKWSKDAITLLNGEKNWEINAYKL